MNLPMNLPKVLRVGNVAQREPEATRVQIRIPGGVESRPATAAAE